MFLGYRNGEYKIKNVETISTKHLKMMSLISQFYTVRDNSMTYFWHLICSLF